MKIKLSLLILSVFTFTAIEAMTRPQLKKSLKMLKKSCMGKHQVTEEQVGTIEQGHFVEEREVMCYIACLYQMLAIVKNNKIIYELVIKQVDTMYPPDLKDNAKAAVDACTSAAKKKDICEASYFAAKCMYEFDPKSFIFA